MARVGSWFATSGDYPSATGVVCLPETELVPTRCCADADPSDDAPACIPSGGDASACDDGNDCTVDWCGDGTCAQDAAQPGPCCSAGGCGLDGVAEVVGCRACVCELAPSCCDGPWLPGCAAVASDECAATCHCTSPCEDGDPCTAGDTCAGTTCVAGPAPDCDDDNPCTVNGCEPGAGCVVVSNASSGTPCDDGDECTESSCRVRTASASSCAELGWPVVPGTGACGASDEAALGGACFAGGYDDSKRLCEAGGARLCTVAELLAGVSFNTGCLFNAENVWSSGSCSAGHLTVSGKADPALPITCVSDSDARAARCCADEQPDGSTSLCQPDDLAGCGVDTDGDCSVDGCIAAVGCGAVAWSGPAGDCCEPKGSPGCDDTPCEACVCGYDASCCDTAWDAACVSLAFGACLGVCHCEQGCDDGDACTTDDVCVGGACAGSGGDCEDADACTTDACDPASGCANEPIDCDDGDPCTVHSCDPATGCVNSAVEVATPCDDGNACTTSWCQVSDKSALSCSALGMNNAAQGADPEVCGETDVAALGAR